MKNVAHSKKKYLGDGVYASFDGYQIWLAVNTPDNDVIALDADVTGALVRYIHRLRQEQEPVEQAYSEYHEG